MTSADGEPDEPHVATHEEPALAVLFEDFGLAHDGAGNGGIDDESDKEGGEEGDDDGFGKVAHEVADDVGPEEHGEEGAHGGEGGGDDGPGNFAGGVEGGLEAWLAFLHVAEDVFDDDDGVVDEHAESKGKTE